jgi:hypothetical protein
VQMGEIKIFREKPVPVPLCLALIPYGLPWDRTRVKPDYSEKNLSYSQVVCQRFDILLLCCVLFIHKHTLRVQYGICICKRSISCQV